MEETLQEIFQNLTTVTQRDYFLDSIEMLESNLYTHQTIYELTTQTVSLPFSDVLIRMYHAQSLLDNDKDGCKEILNQVGKAVKILETLEIRVAFNIVDADVKDIKNWLFYQLKRQILLNIIVDPSLIGGIVLFRNGIYKDYSVANYIDQYGRI